MTRSHSPPPNHSPPQAPDQTLWLKGKKKMQKVIASFIQDTEDLLHHGDYSAFDLLSALVQLDVVLSRNPFMTHPSLISLQTILDIPYENGLDSCINRAVLNYQKNAHECFSSTFNMPSFKLVGNGLVLSGRDIMHDGVDEECCVLPMTNFKLTPAAIDLFAAFSERDRFRAAYWHLIKYLVELKTEKPDIWDKRMVQILEEQSAVSEHRKTLLACDTVADGVGPKKLACLSIAMALRVVLLPLLAAFQEGYTNRGIVTFPLFYTGTIADKASLESVSRIPLYYLVAEPSLTTPFPIPFILDCTEEHRNSAEMIRDQRPNKLVFKKETIPQGSTKTISHIAEDTLCHYVFLGIMHYLSLTEELDVPACPTLLSAISDFLVQFPRIFEEYATFYGWRQAGSEICKYIMDEYRRTLQACTNKLLRRSFEFVLISDQFVVEHYLSDEKLLELAADGGTHLVLTQTLRVLSSEEDPESIRSFIKGFIKLAASMEKIDQAFLTALSIKNTLAPWGELLTAIFQLGPTTQPFRIFKVGIMSPDYRLTAFLSGLQYIGYIFQLYHHQDLPIELAEVAVGLSFKSFFEDFDECLNIKCGNIELLDFIVKLVRSMRSISTQSKLELLTDAITDRVIVALTELDKITLRFQTTSSVPKTEKKASTPIFTFTTEAIVEDTAFTTPEVDLFNWSTLRGRIYDAIKQELEADDQKYLNQIWSADRFEAQMSLFYSLRRAFEYRLATITRFSARAFKGLHNFFKSCELPPSKTPYTSFQLYYFGGLYERGILTVDDELDKRLCMLGRNMLMQLANGSSGSVKVIQQWHEIGDGTYLSLGTGDPITDTEGPIESHPGVCNPKEYGVICLLRRSFDHYIPLHVAPALTVISTGTTSSYLVPTNTIPSDLLEHIRSHKDEYLWAWESVKDAIGAAPFHPAKSFESEDLSYVKCLAHTYQNFNLCAYCNGSVGVPHEPARIRMDTGITRLLCAPIDIFHRGMTAFKAGLRGMLLKEAQDDDYGLSTKENPLFFLRNNAWIRLRQRTEDVAAAIRTHLSGRLADQPIWIKDPTSHKVFEELYKSTMQSARRGGCTSTRPSLWIITDSPVQFENSWDAEIVKVLDAVGLQGKGMTHVFDGIGIEDYTYTRYFLSCLMAVDPEFGKAYYLDVHEKILTRDIDRRVRTGLTRWIDGLKIRFRRLAIEGQEGEHLKRPDDWVGFGIARAAIGFNEESQVLEVGRMVQGPLHLLTLAALEEYPVKLLTIDGYNSLGCVAAPNDLILHFPLKGCNLDDSRPLHSFQQSVWHCQ